MECIKNRRTIRKYTTQDVPSELLNSLLEEAFRASTMGNMQLYSVIVTRDMAMKEKLAVPHFHQPMVTSAPVIVTFCADFNRMNQWCEASDAVPCYGNFQSFLSAMLDVTVFAQQFNTAAEMAGLGCCYIGTTTYNAPQIAEVLKLPRMDATKSSIFFILAENPLLCKQRFVFSFHCPKTMVEYP